MNSELANRPHKPKYQICLKKRGHHRSQDFIRKTLKRWWPSCCSCWQSFPLISSWGCRIKNLQGWASIEEMLYENYKWPSMVLGYTYVRHTSCSRTLWLRFDACIASLVSVLGSPVRLWVNQAPKGDDINLCLLMGQTNQIASEALAL